MFYHTILSPKGGGSKHLNPFPAKVLQRSGDASSSVQSCGSGLQQTDFNKQTVTRDLRFPRLFPRPRFAPTSHAHLSLVGKLRRLIFEISFIRVQLASHGYIWKVLGGFLEIFAKSLADILKSIGGCLGKANHSKGMLLISKNIPELSLVYTSTS